MYQVKIDPNGGAIQLDIKYLGAFTASYVYTLWEANSNAQVSVLSGNNMNSQDDIYPLPSPVGANVGRLIDIFPGKKGDCSALLREIVQ